MNQVKMELFQGVLDRYKGVTVNLEDEPCKPHEFDECLKNSISKWNEEKKRCIWFKVPIKDAALVPLLANEGFNFHHSRDSFVMMYKWLPVDSTPNLPPASHTNLGVGGLVFKNDKEILVVAEQHIDYPHWKLPGGYVERGEDIVNAAVREVKEETGVDSVFESIVTLRHTHKMAFGNSDVYVIVMLKATSESIVKSDDEIRDCKWMDVDEYLKHPDVHEFNRFIVRQAIDLKRRNIKLNLPKSNVKFATWSRDITSLVIEDL